MALYTPLKIFQGSVPQGETTQYTASLLTILKQIIVTNNSGSSQTFGLSVAAAAPTLTALTFRTSGTVGNQGTSSCALTMPSLTFVSVGDLAVMLVETLSSTWPVGGIPTGWTLVSSVAAGTSTAGYYWKVLTASDIGSTITLTSASTLITAAVSCYAGPVNLAGTWGPIASQTGTGTTLTFPSVTTPAANSTVFRFGYYGGANETAPPATARISQSTIISISDSTQVAAGASGTASGTQTSASAWAAFTASYNAQAQPSTRLIPDMSFPPYSVTVIDLSDVMNANDVLSMQASSALVNCSVSGVTVQ